MRYTILAFAIGAIAAPLTDYPTALCPAGLYSNAQCCATDILGVAALNCQNPTTTPTSTGDFISGCAAVGQQAQCCVIPVAGQALLCQDVSPSGNGGINGDANGGNTGSANGGANGGNNGSADDGGANGATGGGAQAVQTPTSSPASQATPCPSDAPN
ncbi:hypothetical protein COCC4DRAFT_186971 [Bipolaris maydis ATCC 48331]|uniref:Hydrophobin n=2 Tax=Cochliobolus heterostrophus TaxID=5016 RepID=M2URC1_COCH5|nr:uncharacterized protein COCC4DRAFT_186971 [Bipolaris maydis ATCC 48331]EMD90447.1 hypothetical protein COCHEDRAFT_1179262 [Bipolaris maydis C5]KAH7555407.1 hypothetical protein BM1_07030 [Bipolaris maydis]ENI09340.1 hypothetical protein COCC4DRAFT_186971 [Bipolaris maydis ATCC 48331]KAJ5023729.1 fungal hydrophobin-domain-containing protein [Bipolaris maydis]KAJ5058330.1 fungal hydrophobin-domain-containing protein [Bipolaris maydis]